MTESRGLPPRLAERLLAAALGRGEWTESVLGDLHEEYSAHASRSRVRAAAWYWLHALRLATRSLAARRRRAPRLPKYVAATVPSARSGDSLMRTLGLEARHACRSILKRPAMSAIVVITLGLGLGANAAVFSMIDALVLRPFTMHDADRITLVSYTRPESLNRREAISPADYLDLKRQTDVFERLAAFDFWTANLVGKDEPENVQGFFVSADFFPVLGVRPAVGRNFLAEEETIGRHRRVVIGHGLWQRRFASDSSIVGQSIDVDGQQHEVVGIAPPGFDFPMGAQIWAPLAFTAEAAANRRSLYITAIGRLAPGRTLEEAKAQAAAVGERLAREHPDPNRGREVRVYTLAEGMMDIGLGPILSMWQASACFVLLIACGNVASLLLARGAERQRELAVRLAIGASRARVVRELLIESAMLALAAVPAALAVTWASLKLIQAYMPAKIARFVAGWHQMDVDVRLLAFTTGLAIVTAILFGLVPALQASRPRLAETLKEGGRSSTAGGSRLRLRRGLVVAEMALALPLLVAAALSILTVHRFLNGPQGFNPDGLLTMRLLLPDARYPAGDARARFAASVVERLRGTPGVDTAAAINVMPSADNNSGRSIEIDGSPNPDPANAPSVDYRTATPDLFAALQIPIRAGRAFTDGDREDTQPVAIVSESLARRHWPNADPLGKRIKFATGPWMTVVGVAGDHIHGWFDRRNYPTLYRPFQQAPTSGMALVIRTSRDPAALAADARAAVRAVDPTQPVFDVRPMRQALQERTIGLQYVGAIMFVFGGLALLLAVIGVYGVMANMVTQRTHEIGVRMALGATRRDVLRLTVGQTGRLTAVGVGIGVALSFMLGRLIEAGLLGVASSDARITGGLAAILVASTLAAGYLPARRAASIDPTVALRGE
jgi:putative ABC transport system permease protein